MATLAQRNPEAIVYRRNAARLVQVPTPQAKRVEPLDVDEACRLLAAAKDDRLYALWAVVIGVGLRRGEALALRWQDVDLDEGWLRVEQTLQRVGRSLQFGTPKTALSNRKIPLPAVCVSALRAHQARQARERAALGSAWTESGLVFPTTIGTPMEPGNLRRDLRAVCSRAEVGGHWVSEGTDSSGRPRKRWVQRLRIHDLRHTCASLLLAQGVSARVVMEILGHSRISLTMNTYTHVLPVLYDEAATKMSAALSGDVSC